MVLRSHSARLLTVLALCVSVVACNDAKKGIMPNGAKREFGFAMKKEEAKGDDQRPEGPNRDNFPHFVENDYVAAAKEPQSTFSASVDTAAYTMIRSQINSGQRPPQGAVRIADMLNYFDYDYPIPQGKDPVAATLELAPCPWNTKHQLLRIALAARQTSLADLPPRNLVFLVDTSGSMSDHNKLPLVKESLNLLVGTLRPRDRVSIVTYAGDASLRLPSTTGDQEARIKQAIARLSASGSTNGGGGIRMAYEQASNNFIEGGINRVILATDGDFNVGVSSDSELVRMIEDKRKTGVYLTVLGYGMGNLQDSKLEQLSRHGNGYYAYIDTIDEARRIFLEQGGALDVVAKDVKLQVEFNHKHVQAYRLIGYENRLLKNEDFRNDAKDAGEMGSGHTVTALYEIVPPGVEMKLPAAPDREFQGPATDTEAAKSNKVLIFRMRYKHPDTDQAKEISFPLVKEETRLKPTKDMQFASAVAAFGLLLRDSPYKSNANWDDVRGWASASAGESQRRREFVELLRDAQRLCTK